MTMTNMMGRLVMGRLLRSMAGVMIVIAGSPGPVFGQAFEPDTDPSLEVLDLGNASVRFQVRVFGLARIVGRFECLYGQAVTSTDRKAESVRMHIDVSSVSTDDESLDNLIRGPAFFDVERYPQITFSNTRLLHGENGLEQIVGDLSLHGTTRRVVFDVTHVDSVHAYDVSSYEAKVTIKRSDYGLYSFRPIVSDEVDIIVAMQTD